MTLYENSGNRPPQNDMPSILERLHAGKLVGAVTALGAAALVGEIIVDDANGAIGGSVGVLAATVVGKTLFDAHNHWVNGCRSVSNFFMRRWTQDS